jgi:hypothetical protein
MIADHLHDASGVAFPSAAAHEGQNFHTLPLLYAFEQHR